MMQLSFTMRFYLLLGPKDGTRRKDEPPPGGIHRKGLSPILAISHTRIHRTKKQPMYEISKDGFSFLVMGFTGSKTTL